MSNFEVFKCNVCNRKIEKLVDQKRAPISKCNITYKCRGNLVKVSESDTKTMSGPATEANISNWVPRGQLEATKQTNIANNSDYKHSLVNVNSAQDVLSIAADETVVNNINELDFVFKVKRLSNAQYVEYFYNRPSNTSLISGQDDSSKRLALRFTSADTIQVYLNGVVQDPSAYDRSVPGRIVFGQPLTSESNQIRVLVFKQDASEYVKLRFVRNDLSTVISHGTSAWGNVEKIAYPRNATFAVFTCTDVSSIKINTRLHLDRIETLNGEIPPGIGYLLIADAPYSSYDRNLNNAIHLGFMASDSEDSRLLIEYKKDEKHSPKFYMSTFAVQSIFPPIAILSKISDDVDTNKVNDSNTKLANAYIT